MPTPDNQNLLAGPHPQSLAGLGQVSEAITRRRNSLFGHVVRLDEDTPAHQALTYNLVVLLIRGRDIVQAALETGGLANSARTTAHQLLISGGEPSHVDTRSWRYPVLGDYALMTSTTTPFTLTPGSIKIKAGDTPVDTISDWLFNWLIYLLIDWLSVRRKRFFPTSFFFIAIGAYRRSLSVFFGGATVNNRFSSVNQVKLTSRTEYLTRYANSAW